MRIMARMFTAEIKPGSFLLNKRLIDLEDTDAVVKLTFADGSKAEADLVIAADGINSVVREHLFGPSPPVYSGTVAYRAIYPTKLLGDMKVPDHTKWWEGDKHRTTAIHHGSQQNMWMKDSKEDPSWLYRHDVLTLPLTTSEPQPA